MTAAAIQPKLDLDLVRRTAEARRKDTTYTWIDPDRVLAMVSEIERLQAWSADLRSMKCELYIARLQGASEGKIVRIEARDGAKLLGRIEIALEGFAEALMGTAAVPAEFSTVRK